MRSKGDDLLCTFPDAEGALKAALHMLSAQATATVEIRIGLHFGTYISARGDIFGDAVNVAARLMQLARPDEGIASGAFGAVLDPRLHGELEAFDQQRLKGKSDVTELYRILPADDDATEMMSARTRMRQSNQSGPVELQLTAGGITRTLYEDDPPLKIGRVDDADIQISNRRVSRAHATIALRDGRAILYWPIAAPPALGFQQVVTS